MRQNFEILIILISNHQKYRKIIFDAHSIIDKIGDNMSDIFKKRMALCGNTVSDSIRTQSDEIMQKTFTNDLGYRQCKLYSRTMEYLEDVEI